MGAGSPGYDLRHIHGWKNLHYAVKWWWRGSGQALPTISQLFTGTVVPIYCAIAGHIPYDSGFENHWCDLACSRCRHFIGKDPSK